MWSLGANLLAPLYRGGALKTQVEIRTAEQKQAIAEYAVVGLRAFGEVEGALAAEIAAREREQILAQVLSDNQQALSVVQTQFKVGSTDLRFVEQRQLARDRHALRAHPGAGRAARAARESPPRARRQLRVSDHRRLQAAVRIEEMTKPRSHEKTKTRDSGIVWKTS